MKLTARLIVVLALMLSVLLIVDGYVEHGWECDLIEQEMRQTARDVGGVLSGSFVHISEVSGKDQAVRWLTEAESPAQEMRIRWVPPSAVPSGDLEDGDSIEDLEADEPALRTYVPLPPGDESSGALELSQPLHPLDVRARRALHRSARLLIGLFLISTVTVLLIGIHLVGRPLQKLRDKAERAGSGDLSGSLEISGRTELAELAAALNKMCEDLQRSQIRVAEETAAKIEAIEMARHADRLRTVGRLASGIAHELGTPLNVVSGRAQLIAEGKLTDGEAEESLQIIIAQVHRISEIIRQLLAYARRRPETKTPVDLARVAAESLVMVQASADKKKQTLTLIPPVESTRPALCNPAEMQQVLITLLMNAIHATPDAGTVELEISETTTRPPGNPDAADAPYVCVQVRDTGMGIPPGNLTHIFEPFFTTKDVGEGTGLGLSIVHGILEDHSGWVTVDSTVGRGSCFKLYLPTTVEP